MGGTGRRRSGGSPHCWRLSQLEQTPSGAPVGQKETTIFKPFIALFSLTINIICDLEYGCSRNVCLNPVSCDLYREIETSLIKEVWVLVRPERRFGAGQGMAWRPVFACLCRFEVAVLSRRCRQVVNKAHLRWAPWPRADYYSYCYFRHASRDPEARWQGSEAGTAPGGLRAAVGRGVGWGWAREGSWRWVR